MESVPLILHVVVLRKVIMPKYGGKKYGAN